MSSENDFLDRQYYNIKKYAENFNKSLENNVLGLRSRKPDDSHGPEIGSAPETGTLDSPNDSEIVDNEESHQSFETVVDNDFVEKEIDHKIGTYISSNDEIGKYADNFNELLENNILNISTNKPDDTHELEIDSTPETSSQDNPDSPEVAENEELYQFFETATDNDFIEKEVDENFEPDISSNDNIKKYVEKYNETLKNKKNLNISSNKPDDTHETEIGSAPETSHQDSPDGSEIADTEQLYPSPETVKEKGFAVKHRDEDFVAYICPNDNEHENFYVYNTADKTMYYTSFNRLRLDYKHLDGEPIRDINDFYDGTAIDKKYLEERADMFSNPQDKQKGSYIEGFLSAIQKDYSKRKKANVSDSLIRASKQMECINDEMKKYPSKINSKIVENRSKIIASNIKPCMKNYKKLNDNEQEDLYNIYENLNKLKKNQKLYELSNHEAILGNISSMLEQFKAFFSQIFKRHNGENDNLSHEAEDEDSPCLSP